MKTVAPPWLMTLFIAIMLLALLVDFLIMRRRGAHVVGVREALRWSIAWVVLSLAFNLVLWLALRNAGDVAQANSHAMAFLTGYLIEKSLAVDNLFVFMMIFSYFSVPPAYQKRVLMIGILGAIALRTVMIVVGAWLIEQYHWIVYVFGLLLMASGIKIWFSLGRKFDLGRNLGLRLLRRLIPISDDFDGERFLTVQHGRRMGTPLLLVVAMVGITDLIFAIDSIPAIFAITTDPFIVLSSNVLAILGLRAMFFLLAAIAGKFHLLNYGLAVIMFFIGGKMLLSEVVRIPVLVSLGFVVGVLLITMAYSARTAPAPGKLRPRSKPGSPPLH